MADQVEDCGSGHWDWTQRWKVIARLVLQVQEVIIATGVDWQDDTIAGGLVTNTHWLVE